MAFHYGGPLSPNPGRRACADVTGRAQVERWEDTDCSECKASLLGLKVEWTSPGGERMVIKSVGPIDVGMDVEDGELGTTYVTYALLDQHWQVVL